MLGKMNIVKFIKEEGIPVHCSKKCNTTGNKTKHTEPSCEKRKEQQITDPIYVHRFASKE